MTVLLTLKCVTTFNPIDKNPRISITHIGLYAALLQYWSEHHYENPVYVFSYEIMKIAKISQAQLITKALGI